MALAVSSITPRNGEFLTLGHLNVLVGPNNCGKSQTLRDIREYTTTGTTNGLKIITEILVEFPSEVEATAGLELRPHQDPNHQRVVGVSSDLMSRHEFAPARAWLKDQLGNTSRPDSRENLLANMGRFWVAHLDAESRFRLAAATDSYDARQELPANAMQAFYAGGKTALTELRTAFREAFDTDIALDWAALKRFYLRVGPSFGDIPEERDKLDALLRTAPELAEQGDGYKSFAGVALAMLTFPNRLLLLDEPDAFLHPAQARVLGRWLGRSAKTRPAQVVIASHSADFLWGVVSAEANVSVIRLNRNQHGTKYHVVPSDSTRGLIQSPLLSSQPVLDALFHRGVVICEGDPDRAIYQTVAHGELRSIGGEDLLFIHTNGKDAVKVPAELLRSAGTPACSVVDFDVLNSQDVLTDIVKAFTGNFPTRQILDLRTAVAESIEKISEADLLKALRNEVDAWREAGYSDLRQARRALASIASRGKKWDVVKRLGLRTLEGEALAKAQRLLNELKVLGVFVVSVGSLESWIPGPAKGQKWNRVALEKLRAEGCPEPLKTFVQSIVTYLIGGAGGAAV